MKSRACFGFDVSTFSTISGEELAAAWKRNFNKDLHQCLCDPFFAGANHWNSCAYVYELDHEAAITAALGHLAEIGTGGRVSPNVSITDLVPGWAGSHAQAELTLSYLTDPIELEQSGQFANGRHRACAILDVVPDIAAIPYRRV